MRSSAKEVHDYQAQGPLTSTFSAVPPGPRQRRNSANAGARAVCPIALARDTAESASRYTCEHARYAPTRKFQAYKTVQIQSVAVD